MLLVIVESPLKSVLERNLDVPAQLDDFAVINDVAHVVETAIRNTIKCWRKITFNLDLITRDLMSNHSRRSNALQRIFFGTCKL